MMYWIHPDYPDAASIFHSHLNRLIQMTNKKNGTPVYICIGTPAIIGDCLGPVIGTILSEYRGRSTEHWTPRFTH